MQEHRRNIVSRLAGMVLCIVLAAASMSSCESFFEYLEPCPHGVSLRFVCDYNMEYANSFHRKADCLTVTVYDEDGKYVSTHTAAGDELGDESYRMRIDLEKGKYRFVVHAGMACEQSSFMFSAPHSWGGTFLDEMRVALRPGLAAPGTRLHDLYCGSLVLETADLYAEGTVELMQNTSNVRVILQNLSDEPVRVGDFDFRITDDNTVFAWDNSCVSDEDTEYAPWAMGQVSPGVADDGRTDVVAAYAEFSLPRLMTDEPARLVISRHDDAGTVVDIPLNNYLLMFKSEKYAEIGDQEYLDRENDWSLVFFLDEAGEWMNAYIKVNDWTVRLDDMEM